MCIHNIIYIYIYIYMKYYRMKLHYIIHCASMEWQSSDKSMAGSPIFLFFASHQYGSIVNGYPCWDTTNIWLVVEPTPLKNDGVRQLGWFFHSQYDGKVKKFHGSKAPTRIFFLPCGKKNTIHSFGFTTSKREISHIQKGTCRWLRLRATNSWGTTLITYASDMVFATPVKQQDISVLHDLVYHQPVTIGYWTCVIPLSSDKIHQC